MDQNPAARSHNARDDRGPFERFVEAIYGQVSRAPFFFVVLAIILVWFVSVPLWANLKEWQVAIHTVASVLSLLLLVLLENAGRRAEESAQEKLNVLAEGLAALMDAGSETDPRLAYAAQRLREASGLEERH